jgi:1-acyl-sn-glycerol-3-phosphate acyltransferase
VTASASSDARAKADSPFYEVLKCPAVGLVPALWRFRTFGRGNLPCGGGALVVSTHQSYLDPIFVGYAALPRQVDCMARADLFEVPGLAGLMRLMNGFAVKRGAPDVEALREALARLAAGRAVVIFPEGTRTRDGSIRPPHPGFATVARRARVPVVPTVIEGASAVWPRGRKVFTLRPAKLMFGRAIGADEVAATRARALAERVEREWHEVRDRLRAVYPAANGPLGH